MDLRHRRPDRVPPATFADGNEWMVKRGKAVRRLRIRALRDASDELVRQLHNLQRKLVAV
jgi:hypothetical protein